MVLLVFHHKGACESRQMKLSPMFSKFKRTIKEKARVSTIFLSVHRYEHKAIIGFKFSTQSKPIKQLRNKISDDYGCSGPLKTKKNL